MVDVVIEWQDESGRPIAGPRLKLIRAAEHIQSLDKLITAWRDDNPDPTVIDRDSEAGRDIYRRAAISPLRATVVLTLGDTVQCLRAALDHAMYAIGRVNGIDDDRIEFPIFLSDLDVPKDGGGFTKGFRSGTGTYLRRLPLEVQEFLTSQQPYNRENGLDPTGHALWGLHELVNLDKHRTIPVLVSVARADRLQYITPNAPDKPPEPDVRGYGPAMNEGDPIVSVPSADKTYLGFDPGVEVEVVLHTPGFPEIEVLTLGVRLYKHVAWAIGQLEPFFGEPTA